MLRNYLKIALRTLKRNKGYTFINIFGLAVGIACCLLILLFVQDEFSYNRFHEKADRIYRVLYQFSSEDQTSTHALTPVPMAAAMDSTFPEVERTVRLAQETGIVHIGEELFKEELLFADADFFQMFSFPLMRGRPEQVLQRPNSVVLSAAAARKYFGDRNPIGQTLAIDIQGSDEIYNFTVTGVTEPIPGNSSITFDLLLPISKLAQFNPQYKRSNWSTGSVVLYVELSKPRQGEQLNAKLPAFVERYVPDDIAPFMSLHLQPLTEVHFTPGLFGSLDPGSRRIYSYILIGIGLFVLLIACINFMTLSIGRSAGRIGEVGVRKVVGAVRTQLMGQFWGEALLTSTLAMVLALLLAELALPLFNNLVGKDLSLDVLTDPVMLAVIVGLVVFVGLVAGSYPAVYLSGFQPVRVLKGIASISGKNRIVRGLIVVQFTLAIFLIIGTLLMTRQMNLLQTKNLGFNEEQVVRLDVVQYREGPRLLRRYRNALADEPRITAVSGSWQILGGGEGVNFESARQASVAGGDIQAYAFGVAPGILETLGIELLQGRGFSPKQVQSRGPGVLVNEAFVRAAGWENPLGQTVSIRFAVENAPVVGVVQDFHFQSLHHPIEPLVLHLNAPLMTIYARVAPGNISEALEILRSTWQEVAPDQPFNFTFLDEQIQRQYASEQRWANIITYAAIFAIVIACLGLFGLAMLAAARRTKEIGIRKILGASVPSIVMLLSRDFLKLVLIGFILAVPLAYLAAERWLQNFAYRIEIGVGTFILAGIIAIGIAFLTVSYQSIKAALANPADSLRYE